MFNAMNVSGIFIALILIKLMSHVDSYKIMIQNKTLTHRVDNLVKVKQD